jgi:hypothetical protein
MTPESEVNKIDDNRQFYSKVKERMYKPVSGSEIMMMLDNKVKILSYKDLESIKTLDGLLEPYQSVVLLYPIADNGDLGHWTALFVNNGTERLEFFDSYGCYIDDKVGQYNQDIEDKRTKIEPYLLKLILESKYADNIHYNDEPYQTHIDSKIATCGLWSTIRLKCKHLIDKEFSKLYYDYPIERGILPDLVVSGVIIDMYPNMEVK